MTIMNDIFLTFSLMISKNIHLKDGMFIFKKLIIKKVISKTYKLSYFFVKS